MKSGFDFSGKKALITGAAGRLGRWISEAFVAAGADVWLVDRNEQQLEQFADSLGDRRNVTVSVADLLKESDIQSLHDKIAQTWKAPDFLINNAGIYPGSLLLDLATDRWDEVMDLNVRAPFLMSKYTSRLMMNENKAGAIVNMISRSARIPRVGAVHYAVSKAALEMMTRGLSMELAPYNIRVNAVSPGFAPGSTTSFLSEEYIEAMSKKIPLGRTSGPDDAPQAIMFLCSEQASFITGTSIFVDGGNTAGDFSIPIVDESK